MINYYYGKEKNTDRDSYCRKPSKSDWETFDSGTSFRKTDL